MKKLLSIIVPAYNAAEYLERCVNSLIVGGDQLDIILVDDGSTDATSKIIDGYASRFPNLIRSVHEKNAGHGGAINNGLSLAKAPYVKVCDSDDWLDFTGLKELLDFIASLEDKNKQLDMIITNYIYDRVNTKHKKIVHFSRLPKNHIFDWSDVRMSVGQYMMMHSITYRTDLLTEKAKLSLPTNVSYDDNIFVFEPLRYVHKMYYLDVDLYHYFIGRDDQSVNENVMLKKIDQQLMINRRMIDFYVKNINQKTDLGHYMRYYLEIITIISSIILIRGKNSKFISMKNALWQEIKDCDYELYRKLRLRPLGIVVNLPGSVGRKLASSCYSIAHKFIVLVKSVVSSKCSA